MRRLGRVCLLAAAALSAASGCAVPRTHARFVAAQTYASGPLPARARVFLVAGGVEVANFAAEVLAQRRLWLARGYAPDEVVCYWTPPTPGDFRADRAQYRELARELRACYLATPALLREHLTQAAGRAPPFVYLYVSSHGRDGLAPEDVPEDRLLPGEATMLMRYQIQVGPAMDLERQVLAVRGGADPDDLVFTPRALQALLSAFPAQTRKLVVLQACHSGGFLDDARPERRAEAIAGVPRLTAIASARFDRTSFGCDSGASMTYFGEVYTRLLARHAGGARPLDRPGVDWPALFTALRAEISALERAVDVRPSLPVLLQTP